MPRKSKGLVAWLAATDSPMFVLDARRKIVFFNHGCEELTGWTAPELLGKICEYRSVGDPESIDAITSALCLPPHENAAGSATAGPFSVVVEIPQRGRGYMPRQIVFVPLSEGLESEEAADTGSRRTLRWLGCILPLDPPSPLMQPTIAQELHAELAALRRESWSRHRAESLVFRSAVMQRAVTQVRLAAGCHEAVHLSGDRGTGKERLARIIHRQSTELKRVFVPIDCRALPRFEVKRAISQAYETAADNTLLASLRPGTLFLRDVDLLPLDVQTELLERMKTGQSIRLMTTTREPAAPAFADAEKFLPELAVRLTTLAIHLTPLSSRSEDILLLAQSALEDTNRGNANRKNASVR